eukprot:TRINITY_DN73920_c0_g1_i1.p1 TRINITY_DN73920_c0_g1~~TRINITY_DN73920_c0_g1_i1.p1  ORF type:complete len:767 (-),score=116.72 TRINITY_DN73920_c0_g1_i1:27-2327(-)
MTIHWASQEAVAATTALRHTSSSASQSCATSSLGFGNGNSSGFSGGGAVDCSGGGTYFATSSVGRGVPSVSHGDGVSATVTMGVSQSTPCTLPWTPPVPPVERMVLPSAGASCSVAQRVSQSPTPPPPTLVAAAAAAAATAGQLVAKPLNDAVSSSGSSSRGDCRLPASSSCPPVLNATAAKPAEAVSSRSALWALSGFLREYSWPLPWDEVAAVAEKVSVLLALSPAVGMRLQSELVALAPRYKPFSRSQAGIGGCGDSVGAWGRSPSALSRCRTMGLQPEEFADLFARCIRRVGGRGWHGNSLEADRAGESLVESASLGTSHLVDAARAHVHEVSPYRKRQRQRPSPLGILSGDSCVGGIGETPRGNQAVPRRLMPPDRYGVLTDQYQLLGKTLRVGRLGVVRVCQRRSVPEVGTAGAALGSARHGSMGITSRTDVGSTGCGNGVCDVVSAGGGSGDASGAVVEQPVSVCRSVARELIEMGHHWQDPAGRVQDDVQVLRGLEHPHIARIQEVMEDDVQLHLISDRLVGSDLYATLRLAAEPSGCHGITESWVASLMLQLTLAVSYIHWRRVIHRNITLRKVMLEGFSGWNLLKRSSRSADAHQVPAEPPKAVLLDAGLAEMLVPVAVDDNSGCGGAHAERPYGTPLFMAPEVFRCEYGPSCDVWALGVITFVLLTGRFPFEPSPQAAGDCNASLEELIAGPARLPTPPAHVPDDAVAFFSELLRKDDACRPRASEASEAAWLRSARARFAVLPRYLYNNVVHLT